MNNPTIQTVADLKAKFLWLLDEYGIERDFLTDLASFMYDERDNMTPESYPTELEKLRWLREQNEIGGPA